MAEFQLSQRDLESILEDLDPIYRQCEGVEEIDTVRQWAQTLYGVARRLEYLASDYENAADEAEARADGECPDCGTPLCDKCGECPSCGDCCVFDEPDVDDDFPLYLEYDNQDPLDIEYDRY